MSTKHEQLFSVLSDEEWLPGRQIAKRYQALTGKRILYVTVYAWMEEDPRVEVYANTMIDGRKVFSARKKT